MQHLPWEEVNLTRLTGTLATPVNPILLRPAFRSICHLKSQPRNLKWLEIFRRFVQQDIFWVVLVDEMTSTYSSAPPMLYQLLTWKSWPAQPPLLSVLLLLCLTKVNKGELSITLTVPQLRLMDPWWSNPSLPGSPRRSFNLKGMLLFRQAQWAMTYFDPRIGSEGKLTPEAGKPQDRSTKVLTVRSQWGIDRCKKTGVLFQMKISVCEKVSQSQVTEKATDEMPC